MKKIEKDVIGILSLIMIFFVLIDLFHLVLYYTKPEPKPINVELTLTKLLIEYERECYNDVVFHDLSLKVDKDEAIIILKSKWHEHRNGIYAKFINDNYYIGYNEHKKPTFQDFINWCVKKNNLKLNHKQKTIYLYSKTKK